MKVTPNVGCQKPTRFGLRRSNTFSQTYSLISSNFKKKKQQQNGSLKWLFASKNKQIHIKEVKRILIDMF